MFDGHCIPFNEMSPVYDIIFIFGFTCGVIQYSINMRSWKIILFLPLEKKKKQV